MKRFNSQSENRKVKRKHLRFKITKIVNKNGERLIVTQRKTTRGYWVNVSTN